VGDVTRIQPQFVPARWVENGLLSTREQEHWDLNLTIDGVAETTGPYDKLRRG
jgi:hypothetical protein